MKHHDVPPFADHKDLHNVIDVTQLGDVPLQSFSVQYTGEHPEIVPPWMDDEFEVWYRDPHVMAHNILANPTFKDKINYMPFHEYNAADDTRRWKDFMSGDWAWQQAVCFQLLLLRDTISKDPEAHGSALVPIILSSDKTTVSVGTGNNEYYPLYASIGNVCNNIWCAHRNALVIISFLTIPKTDRKHSKDNMFRIFHRQLFHSSLSAILSSLKSAMTKYEVVHCGDGHFQCIIYSLGPYIVDYEEQLVLSCIVKHWCPKCIAVRTNLNGSGMYHCHGHTDFLIDELHGDVLWDEFSIIGDLIPFTNNFPQADIHELLSFDLLHQLIKGAFKDHLVDWVAKYLKAAHRTRRAEEIMSDIDCRVAAVPSFAGRNFKQWTGDDLKVLMKVFLPAIKGHIPGDMVHAFCALLEFCYLAWHDVVTKDTLNQIQDTLHRFHHYCKIFDLVAVKEPWHWSSRHNALGQMLVTNQHLDKLAASHVDFDALGMLTGTILSSALATLEQKRAQTVAALACGVAVPDLQDDPRDPADVQTGSLPRHEGKLQVFNSAAATFFAPSDLSGTGGINEHPCNNCVFINTDSDTQGMRGLEVARIICFFSFNHNWEVYPCTLIQCFHEDGSQHPAVIHIKTVSDYIPHGLMFYHSIDSFHSFYVNKFTDHHAFEIAS
ncbi:uncharacterized protein BJ212DRAFT_1450008 [Suillus subaureus]|uniref:CxC2-like cysteine cluster KDZ transposase-associated domain-containing protein n=1 Tax=Suillus subaureus TaxID=48587 RepID=A0A9P7DSK0_9AGAM|nr:uncharacterized protein BJ212DRAFT_1450008 [Suillus subaureus]KAG1801992.1 hypothetical protein BJ212DRAFT_1450008 [Suillus subaureus]